MIALAFINFYASAQQAVTTFQLTDVVSGTTVSLDQYAGKAVVVIFTGNECPYDNYYRERVASLVNQYGSRAVFLFINSHLDPLEAEEHMKKKASAWGFRAPYLSDKSQAAIEALGARRSPEVFLLKSSNGQFTVFYNGAIDDNPQEAGAVSSQYLRDALENLLSGKPAPPAVRAAGCSIRKK
jgi:peroxiredoxin